MSRFRLDDGIGKAAARKSVQRLVNELRLRPLRIGRRLLFTLAELERFAVAETDASGVEADGESDNNLAG